MRNGLLCNWSCGAHHPATRHNLDVSNGSKAPTPRRSDGGRTRRRQNRRNLHPREYTYPRHSEIAGLNGTAFGEGERDIAGTRERHRGSSTAGRSSGASGQRNNSYETSTQSYDTPQRQGHQPTLDTAESTPPPFLDMAAKRCEVTWNGAERTSIPCPKSTWAPPTRHEAGRTAVSGTDYGEGRP